MNRKVNVQSKFLVSSLPTLQSLPYSILIQLDQNSFLDSESNKEEKSKKDSKSKTECEKDQKGNNKKEKDRKPTSHADKRKEKEKKTNDKSSNKRKSSETREQQNKRTKREEEKSEKSRERKDGKDRSRSENREGKKSGENYFICCGKFESTTTQNKLSGCGSVARVVASIARGPRFESSHQLNLYEHLFTVNCKEKTKIKMEAGNGPLKNTRRV